VKRAIALVLIIAVVTIAVSTASKHRDPATIGSVTRGAQQIRRNGCTSCHVIPGIRGAKGMVGPPLEHMARRSYIAGVLPNTSENMVRWLRDPPAVSEQTAMPNLKLSNSDARDIASYLYTLR
jgi:cytochrome c2